MVARRRRWDCPGPKGYARGLSLVSAFTQRRQAGETTAARTRYPLVAPSARQAPASTGVPSTSSHRVRGHHATYFWTSTRACTTQPGSQARLPTRATNPSSPANPAERSTPTPWKHVPAKRNSHGRPVCPSDSVFFLDLGVDSGLYTAARALIRELRPRWGNLGRADQGTGFLFWRSVSSTGRRLARWR